MFKLPPPRFIVKEEGRRLVTIDTSTGERVGLSARPILDKGQAETVRRLDTELSAARQDGPADGARRMDPSRTLPSGADAAPQKAPRGRNASPPPAAQPAARAKQVPADPGRAGRIMILAAIALFAALFLILTYLWVFVAIMLAIPPVRTWLLAALKGSISNYLDPPRR